MKRFVIPPVFVVITFCLIVLFHFAYKEFNLISFPYNLSGLAITFTGFTIMGKSRDLFKKQQTTLDIKESTALITEGVFSRTRNPMYIGMFLLLLGIAVCFMNLFSILAAFCFLGIIRIVFIPKEERLLTSVFKQDYLDYKNKVRRWI